MIKFFKKNAKFILGIAVGVIISGFTVYGAIILFDSDEVGYDNTNTNLQINNADVDNVQDAIDAIYTKTIVLQTQLNTALANEFLTKYKTMSGTPQYYAWNTTPTSTTSKGNHNVYIAKWSDKQLGVCAYISNEEYCFRYNNLLGEEEHIKEVFGTSYCNYSDGVECYTSDGHFYCGVGYDGFIACGENILNEQCSVFGNGQVACS